MNLINLGLPNRAFGLAGGKTGRYIIDSLSEWGVEPQFIYCENYESRTNYLLIEEGGDCTIVAEKGAPFSDTDTARLIDRMKELINPGDFLVLAGDTSNHSDSFIYSEILRALQNKKLKIVLDADGKTLEKGLKWRPFLIKPNLDEFSVLIGRDLKGEGDVVAAIEFLSLYDVEVIAVSLGSNGAVVKTPEGIYKTFPPAVEVKNTIGCGDSFLAGLLYGFAGKRPAAETLKLATAVSAASAESPLSVGFNNQRAKELAKFTRVEKIK